MDVKTLHEVKAIDPSKKVVQVTDLRARRTLEVPYDRLIISPGAAPIRPALPGAELPGVHVLRTMADMDGIIAALGEQPRRVLVVGGGFIGLEVAEALVHNKCRVSLLGADRISCLLVVRLPLSLAALLTLGPSQS